MLIELSRRYAEPHRRYHGVEHVAKMLAVGIPLGLDDLQVMAVWFHDAIYDPRAKDNEEQSARLAERLLAASGWSAPETAAVAAIVRDTADHVPRCERARLVIDLDLMSLAAPTEVYDANSRAIREEYAHVPDAEFAAGSVAFVDRFLARERLFHTAWGERLEAPARANLARLRQRMAGGA